MLEKSNSGSPGTYGRRLAVLLKGHVRPKYLARRTAVAVVLPSVISCISFAATGHMAIVVITALIGALILTGEIWLQKRRDDIFIKKVDKNKATTIEILRAVTIDEAVRSRQLTSDDIVRLFRPDD